MEHYKLMIINFLENPFLVFFLLLLALNYSFLFVPKLPKGILRILALSPVFCLLYIFPWCFSLAFLRGILSFFIAWITSFKLILLCFNRGPLSICENPIDFILISIFPLKIPREARQKYEISDAKSGRKASDQPISDRKNPREVRRKYDISDRKSAGKVSDKPISDRKIPTDASRKYEISNRKSVRKASDDPISDGEIPRDVYREYGIFDIKSVEKASDKPISDGSASKISVGNWLVFSSSIYERYEAEEIFKQPYLATSFQDFWGRR